jgi:hypothetical protein
MNRFLACCLCVILSSAAAAQVPGSQSESQEGFKITKLPPVIYPPIALAAHVSGEVVLKVMLRPDGGIDSAEAVGGPPMLRQAAIVSAKQTQFECVACNGPTTSFRLIYRFDLGPSITCGPRGSSYPRVALSANIVTIAAQPFGTCDPMATGVRSARCLFLWKCGWRKRRYSATCSRGRSAWTR